MKERYYAGMAVVFVVALFFTVGCGGGKEKPKLPEAEQKVDTTQEVRSAGNMNDDLFVEISAYQIYLHHKYIGSDPKRAGDPANLAKMVEELKNICKKHGVTTDEFGNYYDKLEAGDFERFRELLIKATDRAEELKKGNK